MVEIDKDQQHDNSDNNEFPEQKTEYDHNDRE